MFDVSKPEYVNKTFRMPALLIKKLQEAAQEKDVSLNYLIIRCCEYALEDMNKNK